MNNASRDEEKRSAIELFKSAELFDRKKLLALIRKSEKELYNEELQKKLISGFSKLAKIPDGILTKRIWKLLSSKEDYKLARIIFLISSFQHFFGPSLDKIRTIYHADFKSDIHTRVNHALCLSSAQTGWSTNTLRCLIYFAYDFFDYFKQEHNDALEQFQESSTLVKAFETSLTKDPVKAWRMNFSFEPNFLVETPPSSHPSKDTKKWSSVHEAVLERDQTLFARQLFDLLLKEKGEPDFMTEVALNLILAGIDAQKEEFILVAIEKVEKSIEDIEKSGASCYSPFAMLALGYAAIGKIDQAITCIRRIPDDQKDEMDILGLSGSLFSAAKDYAEASKLFFLAFKTRTSPSVWPLKSLASINQKSKHLIQESIDQEKIPDFLDASTGTRIVKSLLEANTNWRDKN